jgi:hypothetical protein
MAPICEAGVTPTLGTLENESIPVPMERVRMRHPPVLVGIALVLSTQITSAKVLKWKPNYPATEAHAWDDIVTRISLSLSGR